MLSFFSWVFFFFRNPFASAPQGCLLLTCDSSFSAHWPFKPLMRESGVGKALGTVIMCVFSPSYFAFIFNCTLLSDRNSVCPDLSLVL